MQNKKFIVAIVVIIVLAVVACIFSYRSGAIKGMQSASVIKGTSTSQLSKDPVVSNEAPTPRWKCVIFGGTWTQYPGGVWDCKWLPTSSVNSTK